MNDTTAQELTRAIHRLVDTLDTPNAKTEADVIDITGIAELLGITPKTVRKMDRRGELPSPVLIGSRRKWRIEELRARLAAGAPSRNAWESIRP